MDTVWTVLFIFQQPASGSVFEQIAGPFVFDEFEKAKDCFRQKLKEIAQRRICAQENVFSRDIDNPIFDQDGTIKALSDYIDERFPEGEPVRDREDGELNRKEWLHILDLLRRACLGEKVGREELLCWPDPDADASDYCQMAADCDVQVEIDGDELAIGGNDGSWAHYKEMFPDIRTNIFDMQEEKDYFIAINPALGQDYEPPKLYGYLRQAKSSEEPVRFLLFPCYDNAKEKES